MTNLEYQNQIMRCERMDDVKGLNKAYSDWFGSLITDAIDEPGEPKAVLFVTLTFEKIGTGRQRRLAEGQAIGEVELDAFNHLYNRVCRDLVGRNYHRESHRSKLPRALAFVDAEGSRYWGTMRDPENLHIHSIWVIPSTQTERLEASLRSRSVNSNGYPRFDAIDIRPVDQGEARSVLRVASYSSKLIGLNSAKLFVAEEFRLFPHRSI